MINVVAICLAGGAGAALRGWIEGRLKHSRGEAWPRGTILVNLTGSLLMGVGAGLGLALESSEWLRIAMVGFLGGYTTFSTAAVQAAEMILADQPRRAGSYAVGLLLGAVACAAGGLWLGTLIASTG